MYEGNLVINIEYNVWFKVKCLEISERVQSSPVLDWSGKILIFGI